MRAARSGRILNVSSTGGYRAAAGFGVYRSTKFAVEGVSEALEAEFAPIGIHVTVVEPGYFRTDFLDASSLSVSGKVIGDFDATAGQVRSVAASLSHGQPGDPLRLADVLVAFADAPNPPGHLPLGSDTVAAIEAKHADDAAILAEWRKVAMSTDFAAWGGARATLGMSRLFPLPETWRGEAPSALAGSERSCMRKCPCGRC